MTDTINSEAEVINSPQEPVNSDPDSINTPSDSIHSPTDNPTPATPDVAGLFPAAHQELSDALMKIRDDLANDNAWAIQQMTDLRNRRRQILEDGISRHQRETDELMEKMWG